MVWPIASLELQVAQRQSQAWGVEGIGDSYKKATMLLEHPGTIGGSTNIFYNKLVMPLASGI